MLIIWSGNWWALALRAAAAILLGILALLMPGPTLFALVLLFGFYAVIDGTLALIAAVRGIRKKERWRAMMAGGIVSLLAGLIALFWPAIGALSLVYLVAAWALLTGAFEIATAVRLRKILKHEWLLIVSGLLSVALAAVMAIFPVAGATVLAWWLGAYALIYGFVVMALAFRVRSWTKMDTIPSPA